jgi:hypothetical protein
MGDDWRNNGPLWDAQHGLGVNRISTEQSPALEYFDEFENDLFWSELISRLARQDALIVLKANNPHDVESEELFAAISKAEDKWSKEFEAFGLSRIRLNKAQLDILH